jgi:hypothetical protein
MFVASSGLNPTILMIPNIMIPNRNGSKPPPSVYWESGYRKEKDVADVTYVSKVRIEPVKGRVRRAYLPAVEEPVMFGVHSEVAEHYGVSPEDVEPHASTLDYLVAAAGG